MAEQELREVDSAVDEDWNERRASATVSYEGGSFNGTIGELREALGNLEQRTDIVSVDFFMWTPSHSASIRADKFLKGVRVSVDGTRASVVHGLVTTLGRKLEPGVGRVREQPLEPPGLWNLAALGGGLAVFLLAGAAVVVGVVRHGVTGWTVGGIIVALGYLASGLLVGLRRERPEPPPLELVPASEEERPAPPRDERGPVLRGRDWLRDHPILGVIGVLALSVAGGLITNAIT